MKDLLNVLYDHYNAQLPLGTVMPYGWTIVEVNYAVEVNDDGELTGIYALGATSDADEVEDKAKTKAKGKDDLEFKRDMLPDSVEVKEYTMDNPDGIIL